MEPERLDANRSRTVAPPVVGKTCPTCRAILAKGAACKKPACIQLAGIAAAAAIARKRRERKARATAVAEARAAPLFKALETRTVGDTGASAVRAVVPHVALAPERRSPQLVAQFLAHLDGIIARCFLHDTATKPVGEADDSETLREFETDPGKGFANWAEAIPKDPDTLNAACIACRGKCCLLGLSSHAFLSERTIEFMRLRFPEMTAEEMAAFYRSFLPDESVERSCLYHGGTGCTLPRPYRAEICNRWQCSAREGLAQALSDTGAQVSLVVGLPDDHADRPDAGIGHHRAVTVDPVNGVRLHDDLVLPVLPPDPG